MLFHQSGTAATAHLWQHIEKPVRDPDEANDHAKPDDHCHTEGNNMQRELCVFCVFPECVQTFRVFSVRVIPNSLSPDTPNNECLDSNDHENRLIDFGNIAARHKHPATQPSTAFHQAGITAYEITDTLPGRPSPVSTSTRIQVDPGPGCSDSAARNLFLP